MPKRILDVGQCDPDHSSLSRFLKSHFDVQIDRAHLLEDALDLLRANSYDLVLINRKLDKDYSDGMRILMTIKADESLSAVPVMIVSNYPDAQEAAVAAGAELGFGKAELNESRSVERVRVVLER
jgi:DNA-binding response OmpR family regulator